MTKSSAAHPRRRFLAQTLWAAGLAAFGVLPSARAADWSVLPPRRVPWTMKPVSSAKIEETVLPDGRVRLLMEHEPLRGVTPAMLVWWWRNIEGEMEVLGQRQPRYLFWHPVDHIHFEVAQRAPGGEIGAGAVFHIVEALGADQKHLIDARLHLEHLEESGVVITVRTLGQIVFEIHAQFLARPEGTWLRSIATLGSSGWLGSLGLNPWLLERYFPAERRRAWIKHSVEEIGNLQFFLPDLYRRSTSKS